MWNEAADRAAVAAASNEIDRLLAVSPNSQGESRGGGVRVMFVRPVGRITKSRKTTVLCRVVAIWRS